MIRNMKSARGNPVANQFIITVPHGTIFQSYETLIAYESNRGEVLLDNAWDCSATTGRYRNQFLNEGVAETRKKIKSGEYLVVNLAESIRRLDNCPSTDYLKGVTISEGSTKLDDLIPKFIGVVEEYAPLKYDEIMADEDFHYVIEFSYYEDNETAMYLYDKLFDILNDIAPDGYYFGTHVRYGAGWGFWENVNT